MFLLSSSKCSLFVIFATLNYKCLSAESEFDYLVEPNYEVGYRLDSWNETIESNPEEMGSYFEGDILVDQSTSRSMITNRSLLWPEGVVPYEIVGPYNAEGVELLTWAINEFNTKTCIKLQPKKLTSPDYLVFTNNKTGCWSFLGMQSGRQEINLQHPACFNAKRKGTILHEIMHALGFVHEHTRPDRDNYIEILWDNINHPMWMNFQKMKTSDVSNRGMPYDYGSLMQYSMFAFSTDGYKKPTLRPKISPLMYKTPKQSFKLGQRLEFSEQDIAKINKLYCGASSKVNDE